MAFLDSPVVDTFSRNSEKSELGLRQFLNQDAGFICRSEVPDKGCDFDVELILDGERSSSWKFPIQLKSIETLKTVNDGKFVSYPFETSRLGYLMRRIPAMGIIVLYSVEEHKYLYEYADKLYTRLMDERESTEWQANDKVNIHIPSVNILSKDTASDIHKTIHNRFEQALRMQNSFGPKYGLPMLNIDKDFKYDFNNLDHKLKFLEEHGLSLINDYEIDMIFKMVSSVPHILVYRSKNILIVAAVAYSESGLIGESQTFCNKLIKIALTHDENLMIQFLILKNQLALGYINYNDFLFKLKELSRLSLDNRNNLIIRLNIIQYELLNVKALVNVPEEFMHSIEEVFEIIRSTDFNDRNKGLNMLWNCENLSLLSSCVLTSSLGGMQIREALGEQIPIEERIRAAKKTYNLEIKISSIISEVAGKAKTNADRLVATNAYALDVRHFLLIQLKLIAFDIPLGVEYHQKLLDRISNAANAFNSFTNLSLYRDAYNALCNLINLVELADRVYFIEHSHNKIDLYKTKNEIEIEFEISPNQIAVVGLLESKRNKKEDRDLAFCKEMDDEQIDFLAATILDSMKLPTERLINIIEELKAYRMFHQRCTDKNVEVIQVKDAQDYSSPIYFYLKSKATGIQTSPKRDMDSLLKGWGY